MAKNKRPTKLEEATFKVHLDIDGDTKEVLTGALSQIKQVLQLVLGQKDIEKSDVSLVAQIVIRERGRDKSK